MDKNMNINVEKSKKNSIIPFLIVIIIILIGVIGLLVFGKEDNSVKQEIDKENLDNVKPVDDQVITENENDEEGVVSKEEKENVDKEEQEEKISPELQAVYDSFGDDAVWASKDTNSPKQKLYYIKDNKIVYENGENNAVLDNIEYGVPKYIYTMFYGGTASSIVVITESGEVYNIEGYDLMLLDKESLKSTKIKLDGKIVDALINTQEMYPYSAPYYLTESGNLITKDNKTYKEINRNHVRYFGTLGDLVFINKDNTLEVMRNYESNSYLTVVNDKGETVKAKAVFYESHSLDAIFYVIDEEDKLLVFSSSSIYVANENNESKGKTVKKVKYNDKNSTIVITFDDNSSIEITSAHQYIELD